MTATNKRKRPPAKAQPYSRRTMPGPRIEEIDVEGYGSVVVRRLTAKQSLEIVKRLNETSDDANANFQTTVDACLWALIEPGTDALMYDSKNDDDRDEFVATVGMDFVSALSVRIFEVNTINLSPKELAKN